MSSPPVDGQEGMDLDGVTVRFSAPLDREAITRLAQLDSTPAPAGPSLVAEVGGELVAALPLDGGRPIADPFRRTEEIVRLLTVRAAQLRGAGPRGSR